MQKRKFSGEITSPGGTPEPVSALREEDLIKHFLVEDLFARSLKFERSMKRLKSAVLKKITAYEKKLASGNGLKGKTGFNLTLTNYSQTVQVIKRSEKVTGFDEKIQLAKQKIDSCLLRWGKDAHPNLKTVIGNIFRVENNGQLNKSALLGLFRYDIDDPEWDEAMELVRKSIYEVSRKEYLVIKFRNSPRDKWKTLNLNFSSIEPLAGGGK